MRALVFGATGQIGSYMAETLVYEGIEVWATVRYGRSPVTWRNSSNLHKVYKEIQFVEADLADQEGIEAAVRKSRPDEVYNFAGLTYAPTSWEAVYHVQEINGVGVVRILDALRRLKPDSKFFQAGSAEVFGGEGMPQSEASPYRPKNPYGVSKLYAQKMVEIYRERYGMFACTGIFFNQESPRRREAFFTRKVADEVVKLSQERIAGKNGRKMTFGPLNAWRDWGLAWQGADAARRMLRIPAPDDYVIGTGAAHQCVEFVDLALRLVGLDPTTGGFYQERPGIVPDVPQSQFMRADPSRARAELPWEASGKFENVVEVMVKDARER